MEHWEELAPGGLRLLWDDALFPPGASASQCSMADPPSVVISSILPQPVASRNGEGEREIDN